jgi:hypothetical protein
LPPSRIPGGSSQLVPPFCVPATCQASTCFGESHAKPTVLPFPMVCDSPLIGKDAPNEPAGERQKMRWRSTKPDPIPSVPGTGLPAATLTREV